MSDISEKVASLEATQKSIEEKRVELEKVKAETDEAKVKKQTELEALDKEKSRVLADIEAARAERKEAEKKDSSFQEKLRSENLEAAKEKFFAQFGIKPEEQARFFEEFKKFDSQAVNTDLIEKDLRRTYAYLNADSLIETSKKVAVLQENSEEFKSTLSSMSFAGAGAGMPAEGSGLTPEDIQAAQWSGVPIEKYKELKARGLV